MDAAFGYYLPKKSLFVDQRRHDSKTGNIRGRCSVLYTAFWILNLDAGRVNERRAAPKAAKPGEKAWQKAPFANLIRYVSSGTYYARLRSTFSFSLSTRSQLKKCSHSEVMLPTLVSMAFDRTQKALVRKSCGISFL